MNRDSNDKLVELKEKLVSARRVTKVTTGGRTISFSVLVVVGDGQGRAGFGTGKAMDVTEAIRKATAEAKRNMKKVPLKDGGRALHQDCMASFGKSTVYMRESAPGTGVKAGGALRKVLEVLGIRDVSAKIIGSSNPGNVVRAAFAGFESIQAPRYVAAKRGKSVGYVFGKSAKNDAA